MTQGLFFRQFGVVTFGVALLLLGLQALPELRPYKDFCWLSLAFFALFSLSTYLIGAYTATQKNKFAFTNATLKLTFIKMLLCVVVVGLYIKLTNPPTRTFILPFLGIYIIYTIFETHFMMKIGKNKGKIG